MEEQQNEIYNGKDNEDPCSNFDRSNHCDRYALTIFFENIQHHLNIQVTSTDTVTKDANGKKKQQVYSYKKDDKKYTEIVNVLDQYSYHFTTKTLTNSSQMSDSSKPQMIMLFGNKMLVISDSGEILLDNHVYRMGYSGGKDAKKMMKSINKILKSE